MGNAESIFWLPAGVCLDSEQVRCQFFALRISRRGCHIQRAEIFAAKSAGGHIGNRKINDPVDGAFRRDTHDAAAIKSAVPQVPVGIDRRSVWNTARKAFQKWPLPGDASIECAVVVAAHGISQTVAEVETSSIRAPRNRVRDPKVGFPATPPEPGLPIPREFRSPDDHVGRIPSATFLSGAAAPADLCILRRERMLAARGPSHALAETVAARRCPDNPSSDSTSSHRVKLCFTLTWSAWRSRSNFSAFWSIVMRHPSANDNRNHEPSSASAHPITNGNYT